MVNGHIALAFQELAALLELRGESPFKTKAYRAFADSVNELTEPLAAIAARGDLEKMPGVGKAIAGKTRELLENGSMRALDEVRAEIPSTLPALLRISGLGPAKTRKLWQEAGVVGVASLVEACRSGRLATIAGFGGKIGEKILAEAEAMLSLSGYVLLGDALALGGRLAKHLMERGAVRARVAGGARRGQEIVDEVVVVASGLSTTSCAETLALTGFLRVTETSSDAEGDVRAEPTTSDGPRVRVRCVPVEHALVALLEETGDSAHVRALVDHARALGTTLEAVCETASDEDAAYRALGLAPVAPEQREGATLLHASAVAHEILPLRGVRGILHVHTTWSDGSASIADMARAALEAGYAYVGISDHSRAASYANGLDVTRLAQQRDEIEQARREVPQIAILHGLEVDILDDGSLDLPDEALAKLDFVVASVHGRFQLDRAAQTKRVVRAVSHPLVTILGHPTGRLLLGRAGYDLDLDEVARAAARSGCTLEINASPQRLDLSADRVRAAAALGARFCINPDAHEPRGFGDVPLGVAQARRAGLRSDQVLNAMTTEEILPALEARRAAALRSLTAATA